MEQASTPTPQWQAGSRLVAALSMALLAVVPFTLFPALLLLRLLMGAACSVRFILGEAWINQMASAATRHPPPATRHPPPADADADA
ncbi:hypothetical protein DW355_13940 [Hylemonella gracilis]|uniref:Uncharacterized protein n=1 Tax=Hylemonella gracilis TaxID=80880 RepID=A0A4P6ULX4_9BURK|nr:hypothetical protein [Hylemonella gracilis]QBK05676.1 hypothetical protein DW355_13940 [Hylemonella gracilis]